MQLTKDFILRYDVPGPRYTSYPPANYFHEGYTVADYLDDIEGSNELGEQHISLYFHIPFCPQRCHFCGCTTATGYDDAFIARYLDALKKETENVSGLLQAGREVSQVHWGGGTPNALDISQVEDVMRHVRKLFQLMDGAEIAIECNPAYLSKEYISRLRGMGFNRISLGVQDFHPEVLEMINRKPPAMDMGEIVKIVRAEGFEGLNIDLVYGLPGQTIASYSENIDRALALQPDRLVTFSYAHVPKVQGHQKEIEKYGLPEAGLKTEMFLEGFRKMTEAGYVPIGLDHFAKPTDELAKALENKQLHRNFQGYCTRRTTGQVYGMGASSISQLENAYAQNIKHPEKYLQAIEKTGLATMRGYRLNAKEKSIRQVINNLMCNGRLDFRETAGQLGCTVDELKSLLSYKAEKLEGFVNDGLLNMKGDNIRVNRKGFMVIRNIAMAFDPLMDGKQTHYSKTL